MYLTYVDVDMGDLSVSWQKSFHEDNATDRARGSDAMALSAFLLSSLPTHVDRKLLVKEMWDSGAEVMVRSSGIVGRLDIERSDFVPGRDRS